MCKEESEVTTENIDECDNPSEKLKGFPSLLLSPPFLSSKKFDGSPPPLNFAEKKSNFRKLSFSRLFIFREARACKGRKNPKYSFCTFFSPTPVGIFFFFSRDFPFSFFLPLRENSIFAYLEETGRDERISTAFPRDSPIFLNPGGFFLGKTESCFCCVVLLKIRKFKYRQFPPASLESCCLLPSPSDKGDRYRQERARNEF